MEPNDTAAEKIGEAAVEAGIKIDAAAISAANKVLAAARRAGKLLDENIQNPVDPIDEDRVRDLVREAVTKDLINTVVKATVTETLLQLGMDTSNPIEMQKDFVHLRNWRGTMDSLQRRSMLTIATIIVTGLLGMIAWSFKDLFHLTK